MKNQRGSALILMMTILIVIGAILAEVISSGFSTARKILTVDRAQIDEKGLRDSILMVYGYTATCSPQLNGPFSTALAQAIVTAKSGGTLTPVSVELNYPNGDKFLSAGARFNSILIEDVQLTSIRKVSVNPTTNSFVFNVRITINQPTRLIENMPLYVVAPNDTPNACYFSVYTKLKSIGDTLDDLVCQNNSWRYPGVTKYEPETNTCIVQ